MGELPITPFSIIYDDFFARVTDDMYMDVIMTKADTEKDLQTILLTSIPKFEFPRFDVFDYELGERIEEEDEDGMTTVRWEGGYFNSVLTREEINILSLCMMEEWFERQIATTELTREKYSGSDFKFTSQANHLSKLKVMKDAVHQDNFHLQRLYKRRKKGADGRIRSTFGQIMETPTYGHVLGGLDYDN